ncbi:hypothetical protein HYH03_007599 [Edaphochlamys debaryana]|uniref:GPR1/FUN34/yaaH family protein n=1 Tax=Edaphochlamys debaryana TaxID=47281 RepID=A0A836C0A0_9CHLO|nr:hypothetical protein HYH03_007599 [Edaphochlamys debaryana]|eukprot:KAG2494244.1 hypothetical protein HYH03_007599 [Edaphochlamys debaryana]
MTVQHAQPRSPGYKRAGHGLSSGGGGAGRGEAASALMGASSLTISEPITTDWTPERPLRKPGLASGSSGSPRSPGLGGPREGGEWVRGDPGPLGLICQGINTWCVGGLGAGGQEPRAWADPLHHRLSLAIMLFFTAARWAEAAFLSVALSYGVCIGGAAQVLAGVLELIKGNTFGGTTFVLYGAGWGGWYLLHRAAAEVGQGLQEAPEDPDVARAARAGMALWAGLWMFLTGGFLAFALRRNVCLVVIFATLVATNALQMGAVWSTAALRASGYVGLSCGAACLYTAFAILWRADTGQVLPGLRRLHAHAH